MPQQPRPLRPTEWPRHRGVPRAQAPPIAAIAVTAAISALTTTAAPAIADTASIPSPIGGTVTLSVPNITLSDGCQDAPSSYVDSWDADVSYAGPTDWPAGDFLHEDSSGTFTGTLNSCPSSDEPGSYLATAEVEVYGADYNETDVTVTDAFTITKATTSLRAWRSGNTLTGEFRENGKVRSGTVVELQKGRATPGPTSTRRTPI